MPAPDSDDDDWLEWNGGVCERRNYCDDDDGDMK